MIGALILGILAGIIARAIVPNDILEGLTRVASWAATVALGLVGALVGFFVFTSLLGIGDNRAFNLGGLLGAIIGAVIVLWGATFVVNRRARGIRPQ